MSFIPPNPLAPVLSIAVTEYHELQRIATRERPLPCRATINLPLAKARFQAINAQVY